MILMSYYLLIDFLSLCCFTTLFFFSMVLPSFIFFFFFLNDPAPPEIYPLPLPDALPIYRRAARRGVRGRGDARGRDVRAARARARAAHPAVVGGRPDGRRGGRVDGGARRRGDRRLG